MVLGIDSSRTLKVLESSAVIRRFGLQGEKQEKHAGSPTGSKVVWWDTEVRVPFECWNIHCSSCFGDSIVRWKKILEQN